MSATQRDGLEGLAHELIETTEVTRVVESFADFYQRELRRAAMLGCVLTGSLQAGEDLAQDALFDAYRRWTQIGRYDDPAGWVRRAVANRAVSLRRRSASQAAALLRLHTSHDRTGGPGGDTSLGDDDLWAQVRRLPRRQQQVIALHYVAGLSTAEIARDLGVSQAAVKTHLQRGRATLAERLEGRR